MGISCQSPFWDGSPSQGYTVRTCWQSWELDMRPPHSMTGLLYVLPFARLQIACPSVCFFLALAFQCLRYVFFFNGVVSVAIGRCLGSLLVWGWRYHGTLFPGSSFLQAPGTWREWGFGGSRLPVSMVISLPTLYGAGSPTILPGTSSQAHV